MIKKIFLVIFLLFSPECVAQINNPTGGTISGITAGTGLTGGGSSGSITLSSQAIQILSFQPGLLATIVNSIGGFTKISKASTVDNLSASSITFNTCSPNPTITMYECGTSTTCMSPTTIGTVTITSNATVVAGTVSNPTITAGDYIGWAITTGTCVALNISATAQVHAN